MPRVKRVTPEDTALLAAIEGIEAQTFSDPWSLQSICGSVNSLRTRVYAALDDTGTLMGYLFLTQVMDVADVDNIAVAPAFRRQGVASLLLEWTRRCSWRCGHRTRQPLHCTGNSALHSAASGGITMKNHRRMHS